MFNIGGCASCHATPNEDADKVDRTKLGGGLAAEIAVRHLLRAEYFFRPGRRHWRLERSGFCDRNVERHIDTARPASFPGVPVHVLSAHGARRPARSVCLSENVAAGCGPRTPSRLGFPFNIRRLVGVWKLLFFHGGPFTADPAQSAQWNRGAYLVNGPGHCAECHSPRNALGAIIDSERFAGGPAPDGKGWVPNITPAGLQHSGDDDSAWKRKGHRQLSQRRHGSDRRLCRRGDGRSHSQHRAALPPPTAPRSPPTSLALPPRQGPKPPAKKKR